MLHFLTYYGYNFLNLTEIKLSDFFDRLVSTGTADNTDAGYIDSENFEIQAKK